MSWTYRRNQPQEETGSAPELTTISNGSVNIFVNDCKLDDGQLNTLVGLLEQMPEAVFHDTFIDKLNTDKTADPFVSIRDLQRRLPWTVKYSKDFRNNPQGHKDFAHALTHVIKAAGKLAEIVDNLDHNKEPNAFGDLEQYVSDLVVCALRMANTAPDWENQVRPFDLQGAVIKRIETKNGVKL